MEAGHRCAIPTCRATTTEIAHIEPFARAQKHEYHNLIALCPNCHTRFDKGEIDRNAMRMYKRKIAFLSDRYSRFELTVLDYLRYHGKVVVHGELSVKGLLDDSLIVNASTLTSYNYDDGTKDVLDFVAVLTEKGVAFLANWARSDSDSLTY